MQRWTTTYGITRVQGCCLFRWFEREGGARTIEIRDEHCANCIAEIRVLAESKGLRLLERGPIRRSILIVDDDADIREGLAAVLEDEGFLAYQAKNGREALVVLEQMPRPSAVLVDLMMPEMNGWQLASVLKTAGLPVIIITAAAGIAQVDGARHVIQKPLSIDRLVSAIESAAN
jgi:CheY-like chemotaxis protein